MQLLADIVGYILQIAIVMTTFIYAPFAKNGSRAIGLAFIIAAVWGILRCVTIISFKEEEPPLAGFIILPFFCILYSSALRGLKILLFKIPFLSNLEKSIRSKFEKINADTVKPK